jgi:hypothetical protein
MPVTELPIRVLPGQVVVSGAASLNGIESEGDAQFGTIAMLYEEGTFSLGNSVMFYLKDSHRLTWLGTLFFLLKESDIKLVETILP